MAELVSTSLHGAGGDDDGASGDGAGGINPWIQPGSQSLTRTLTHGRRPRRGQLTRPVMYRGEARR